MTMTQARAAVLPRGDLLAELRAATRPQHDRIERLLALDMPMPLSRYAAIVAGFHRFLRGWESELRAALPPRLHGWLDERRRAGFAAADLAFLGVRPVDAPAPRCLPEASLPAAFGSLYVIEGSALGGQVVTRWLKHHLGLEPGGGASYFHGHGERTGAMWRDFRLLAVAEVGDDTAARRTACHAAQRTFQALLDDFEPLAS
jgi:heme oxygenase (biliverdin-IX-beta and delta-forming)